MRTFLLMLAIAVGFTISGSSPAQQAGVLVSQSPYQKNVQAAKGSFYPDLFMPVRDTALPRPVFRLSAARVVETQGWFCNRELQVQKATRLPLYFRLGSKEYADRMEGKQGYLAR
jgi:hypothetical protein